MNLRGIGVYVAILALGVLAAQAQDGRDLAVFRGLAPVTVLPNSDAGKAALGANLRVTGGIQNGSQAQRLLQPMAVQQQQALKDAAITSSNLEQLSDGLGTALGSAYLARFHGHSASHGSLLPDSLIDLIRFALAESGLRSAKAKMFFANGTNQDGKTPVSEQALAIVNSQKGSLDVMGRSYGLPAGAEGADRFGNSRPFQTEPVYSEFTALDYQSRPVGNTAYNRGPAMNLVDSPSYPSGHTTYGFTGALLLALLVPERYGQMFTRGAEYGTDRILMGSHYAMDVIGGRTLALYELAHLLANDPAYLDKSKTGSAASQDFNAALLKARADLRSALEASCGRSVEQCAAEDLSRFSHPEAASPFVVWTLTYGLPVVYPQNAAQAEDVDKIAPEAGHLLTAAFPALTLEQANAILTETEGPGGGFLDNGSGFGVYSRLNLEAAARRTREVLAGK